jgi:hypothetical protein
MGDPSEELKDELNRVNEVILKTEAQLNALAIRVEFSQGDLRFARLGARFAFFYAGKPLVACKAVHKIDAGLQLMDFCEKYIEYLNSLAKKARGVQ